jgi:hypothetical protein
MMRASRPEESGVLMHFELERQWCLRKHRPNPFLEFALGWLHRNPPLSHGRETQILWDSGQFHHENGHLTAILDLEFGHIGDPIADLTVWRMRDTLIPFGDFRKIYARYEGLSGRQVDIEAARRHHLAAALSNEMIFGAANVDPVPGMDLMNNLQWTSETTCMPPRRWPSTCRSNYRPSPIWWVSCSCCAPRIRSSPTPYAWPSARRGTWLGWPRSATRSSRRPPDLLPPKDLTAAVPESARL